MRRAAWAVVAAVVAGCSDDALPMADFAEVCGQDGPAQILPLETDEVVNPWLPNLIGGRTYFGIRRFDHPITNVGVTTQFAASREYAELDARIESIGPCGEDRRVVAEGVDHLIARASDDEPWLALRTETREVFWVDVDSPRAARPVFQGERLQFVVRGNRIWQLDAVERRLDRHTLAGNAIERETIFEDVESMWPATDDRGWYDHEQGELLVLLATGELVALDFRTESTEIVAENIGGFAADPTQRWIIGWPLSYAGSADDTTDTATLFERGQSVSYLYGTPGERKRRFGFNRDVLIEQITCDAIDFEFCPYLDSVGETTFTLPSVVAAVVLEGEWGVTGSTLRGEFMARNFQLRENRVFGVRDGELRELFPVEETAQLTDDAVVMQRCAGDGSGLGAVPPCDVVSISLATGRAETLERDTWSDIVVPGHRWVGFDGGEPDTDQWRQDPRGELTLFDAASGITSLIDRHVSPEYRYLVPRELGGVSPWHTEEIVYQVRSLRDDRTGLWRARFD